MGWRGIGFDQLGLEVRLNELDGVALKRRGGVRRGGVRTGGVGWGEMNWVELGGGHGWVGIR